MKLKHTLGLTIATALLLAGCTASGSITPTPTPTPSMSPSAAPTASPAAELSTTVSLMGSSEVPPVTTDATGTATVTLSAARDMVTVSATVSGLSGEATMAHFHRGATGVSGPVVKDITVSGNTLTATWRTSDATQPLTAELLQALLNGELYINVHTAANPNGEIRGQVMLSGSY